MYLISSLISITRIAQYPTPSSHFVPSIYTCASSRHSSICCLWQTSLIAKREKSYLNHHLLLNEILSSFQIQPPTNKDFFHYSFCYDSQDAYSLFFVAVVIFQLWEWCSIPTLPLKRAVGCSARLTSRKVHTALRSWLFQNHKSHQIVLVVPLTYQNNIAQLSGQA